MSLAGIIVMCIFAVFMIFVLFRPEVLLDLQKKVYSVIGIELNYGDKARFFVRIIVIFVLVIAIFGLYQSLG